MRKEIVDDIYKIAEKYGYTVIKLEEWKDSELSIRFKLNLPMSEKMDYDTNKMCEEVRSA